MIVDYWYYSKCEYCHKKMTQEDQDEDKVIWFYDGWYHRICYREEDMKSRPNLYREKI